MAFLGLAYGCLVGLAHGFLKSVTFVFLVRTQRTTRHSGTLPAMAFVMELLVLDLVHHFFIARTSSSALMTGSLIKEAH